MDLFNDYLMAQANLYNLSFYFWTLEQALLAPVAQWIERLIPVEIEIEGYYLE